MIYSFLTLSEEHFLKTISSSKLPLIEWLVALCFISTVTTDTFSHLAPSSPSTATVLFTLTRMRLRHLTQKRLPALRAPSLLGHLPMSLLKLLLLIPVRLPLFLLLLRWLQLLPRRVRLRCCQVLLQRVSLVNSRQTSQVVFHRLNQVDLPVFLLSLQCSQAACHRMHQVYRVNQALRHSSLPRLLRLCLPRLLRLCLPSLLPRLLQQLLSSWDPHSLPSNMILFLLQHLLKQTSN